MTTQTDPKPTKRGRPRKDRVETRFWDGKLYALLKERLPHHVRGDRLIPASLAESLNVARWTVYKALNNDKLSSKLAKALIDESRSKLTQEDLAPFVFA